MGGRGEKGETERDSFPEKKWRMCCYKVISDLFFFQEKNRICSQNQETTVRFGSNYEKLGANYDFFFATKEQ